MSAQPLKPAAVDAVEAISDESAKKVLERMLGEAMRAKSEAEAELREQQQLATVTLGKDGLEASSLAGLWRMALMYSRADIVPDQYKLKPENCLIALQMAQRCKMDPFAFMQSSYIVHGRPGIEGKLVIAMLNASGKIKGRMRFKIEGEGDKMACTATVVDAESGEAISLKLDWKTVRAEGWDSKPGSKWKTIPEQMFRYRAAVFLVRAHYPEVMMGLHATEELEDIDDTPAQTAPVDTRPKAERLADFLERPANGDQPTNGNGTNGHELAEGELPAEQPEHGDAYEGPAPTKPEPEPVGAGPRKRSRVE